MSKVDPEKMYVTEEMLDQAVEVILEGVDKFFGGLRGEMKALRREMNERFDNVEVELSHVKDTVNALKAELSDTRTRREFEGLKRRIHKYLPRPETKRFPAPGSPATTASGGYLPSIAVLAYTTNHHFVYSEPTYMRNPLVTSGHTADRGNVS